MKLTIWTSAESDIVKRTFASVLRSFRPDVPEHEFLSWRDPEEEPPAPAAGGIVLVCGKRALDTLQRHKIAPKNRTVNSMREKPIPHGGGHYLVTHDPNVVNSEADKLDVIEWDVRLAVRLIRTGQLLPPLGAYRWVNDYQPMIDWIEKRFKATGGKAVDVTSDTETMGFFPWYADKDIVSISFTAKPETAEVLYLGPQKPPIPLDPSVNLFDQIKWLLTSPKVKMRFANGKYDLVWIAEKWGIECTNFKFDTMLVGSLLNENRSNSLNLHAKVMTPIGGYDDPFNSKFDKSSMEKIPADDNFLIYAGGDTDAAHRVANTLRDELMDDPQLANFYITVLHPAARSFEKIERRGVLVDQEKYAVLRQDLRKSIDEAHKVTLDLLPNKMRIKYRDRIENQLQQGKSPMLPSILKEFFFSPHGLNLKPKEVTAKTHEPSMAKSHLRQFANVPEASAMVAALTEADSAMKTLSTFVDGFLKHLRPDGRFHTTYFLAKGEYEGYDDDETGTNTGRLSAKNPPFQVTPKKTKWAKRIRECFPAPKGKLVLSCDYSQGELKVVACVAPENTMLQAYEDGLDLHAVTGAKLAHVDLTEFLSWQGHADEELAALYEKNRGNAKPANFGLLYGMQVEGFRAYAWANYGIKLSYAEAEAMRNAFFELYPGLLTYHSKQKDLVKFAQMVRSPLGRVRHLPMISAWDREIRSKAERQAINSPIQSCLSDMMLWAIALIDDAYPNGEIEVVGMIHDALIAYIPEQDADLWAGRCVEIMSNLPFHEVGWKPQLKFTADAEAGTNLANIKKLKLDV
ncbi:DNA polymerase [Nitratireductor sp. OM-1]|uniref:DNA polymerase n=1 Tax=Nitratireductor sp. OM-1 TaxID=1756988 RepID=UPI000DDE2F06|nr:DNA polymerase [Nitratireductor sp. OM-1]